MGGLFGSPSFDMPQMPQQQPGMTFEQHRLLLEREAELARMRDEQQADFLAEQEALRLQQEEVDRERIAREEAELARQIAEQEQEAAEGVVADDLEQVQSDTDEAVANMYEALLGGVGEEEDSEPTPE